MLLIGKNNILNQMAVSKIIKLEDISNIRVTSRGIQLEMKIDIYNHDFLNGHSMSLAQLSRIDLTEMVNMCFIVENVKDLYEIPHRYETAFVNRRGVSHVTSAIISGLPSIYNTMCFEITYIDGLSIMDYMSNKITVYFYKVDDGKSFFAFHVEDIAVTRREKLMKLKSRINEKNNM